jgi:four helix bundle protein
MNMEQEMKDRTGKFALDIIRYSNGLRGDRVLDALARQFIRSGTSVYLNYRAVCRARTTPDFINKLAIVEEESDETAGCLELL